MKILDLLLLAREYVENEEGEVITFSDSQMAKIKDLHYLQLHSLIGPDSYRENILICTIISGNIDDVIAALVPGEKKNKIVTMDEKVTKEFNNLVTNFISLRSEYFFTYNENRKDFALALRNKPMFGSVMKSLYFGELPENIEKIAEESAKEYILKQTNFLGKAKDWIEGL